MTSIEFDEDFDVVVVGSGGGALVGAYVAALNGLRTVVLESTDKFGGTTAYSGAGLWLPGNPALERGGVVEPLDDAREYLRAVVGEESAELQDAFLDACRPMVTLLEENPMLEFAHRPFPDYFPDAPKMRPAGRDIFPVNLQRSELGEIAEQLRPALPTERQGAPAPDELTGGQALIGRLLLAVGSANCELRLQHTMDDLVVDDDGNVVGVEVVSVDGRVRIAARTGVLLAAGGFERNEAMRSRHGVPGRVDGSMGAPGGVGRPIEAAIAVGAATDLMDQAWWAPGLMHPDGTATFTLGFRGGIFVNAEGVRFANESLPYDQMGRILIEAERNGSSALPFWFVFDERFGDGIPANATVPLASKQAHVDAGLWKTAASLEELALEIGVPADRLVETVERFNGFAAEGVDADFHRGEAPFDLYFANGEGPNPALVPIDRVPFHAVQFALSDLGTKGGLITDASGNVLRTDGSAIGGLYAAGNTMASMTRNTYPGPGTPIGTCMVFSYLAVLDMLATGQ